MLAVRGKRQPRDHSAVLIGCEAGDGGASWQYADPFATVDIPKFNVGDLLDPTKAGRQKTAIG